MSNSSEKWIISGKMGPQKMWVSWFKIYYGYFMFQKKIMYMYDFFYFLIFSQSDKNCTIVWDPGPENGDMFFYVRKQIYSKLLS